MWTNQVYGHHDKMASTKTHRYTTHEVYKDATYIKKKLFCVLWIFLFFIFNFQLLKGLLQNMLIYRLGTVNEIQWGFKPVFRCSKPHIFLTFVGEAKDRFPLSNMQTCHLSEALSAVGRNPVRRTLPMQMMW